MKSHKIRSEATLLLFAKKLFFCVHLDQDCSVSSLQVSVDKQGMLLYVCYLSLLISSGLYPGSKHSSRQDLKSFFNALNLCCNSAFLLRLTGPVLDIPSTQQVFGYFRPCFSFFLLSLLFAISLLFAHGSVVLVHWDCPTDALSWSEKFKQCAQSFRQPHHDITDFELQFYLQEGKNSEVLQRQFPYSQIQVTATLTEKQITSLSFLLIKGRRLPISSYSWWAVKDVLACIGRRMLCPKN